MALGGRVRAAEDSPSLAPSLNSTSEFGNFERSRAIDAPCPEIACLRGLLAAGLLAEAEERSRAVGVGADRVLITAGAISEEDYLRRLADALGLTFDSLDGVRRAQCPLGDERLIEAVAGGMLPLTVGGKLYVVVAPRGTAARGIMALVDEMPELARRIRFTTSERLSRFVFRHSAHTISAQAVEQLKRRWPVLSAAPPRWLRNIVPVSIVGIFFSAALMIAPTQTTLASGVLLTAVFLAWIFLRIIGLITEWRRSDPPLRLRDDELPVYTVISPLYREAASVDGLLTAIERFDYPPEKLDVKLVVEADDAETRNAIALRNNRVPVEIIIAPPSDPRTKPKALNVALPFARGSFVVIYDAEDRPEPGQLRRALQAFTAARDDLACVQASLTIDNTEDGWLAALFTAEYAGQFDVFLPGIAALRLPLPLGGSSNHFRTSTLRKIGGWDPYNVTEDADLGMRLARFGYRAGVIDSTTYEEAPVRLRPWLKQRTRWFKGWLQTWLVHMREPRRLVRDLGISGFFAFQLIVGGNVLAALVHPLFLGWFVYGVMRGTPMWTTGGLADAVLVALFGTAVVIGYGTSAFLGWLGLARRGLLSSAWILLLMPAHWLLLSAAAWRALFQLMDSPYRWEKTEHGLARSSRLASSTSRSLSRLERHITQLLASEHAAGIVPGDEPETTYTSAVRRRTLPASGRA